MVDQLSAGSADQSTQPEERLSPVAAAPETAPPTAPSETRDPVPSGSAPMHSDALNPDDGVPPCDLSPTLRRVVSSLLEALGLNAFRYSPRELGNYVAALEGFRRQFEEAQDAEALLSLCSSTMAAHEQYSAGAEHFISARRDQTRKAIEMLTASLIDAAGLSGESGASRPEAAKLVEELGRVRDQLVTALRVEDLAAANRRLETCLAQIAQVAAALPPPPLPGRISSGAAAPVAAAGSSDVVDPITGLLGAQSAARTIRAVIEGGVKTGFLLVFSLERIQTVNLRFGYKVGDKMLFFFAQHLAQEVSDEDSLFRWRGPCFVILSQREQTDWELTMMAKRVTGTRLTHTVNVGEREISLPVVSQWKSMPLSEITSYDHAVAWLDEFSASVAGPVLPVRRRSSR